MNSEDNEDSEDSDYNTLIYTRLQNFVRPFQSKVSWAKVSDLPFTQWQWIR